MSKRAYESGSSKGNKATAETEALRVVIEKTKPITQFLVCQKGLHQRWLRIRGAGVDSGRILRFLSDPEPELKICETPDLDPESLFIFSSTSQCGFHIWHFLSKNVAEFRLHRW